LPRVRPNARRGGLTERGSNSRLGAPPDRRRHSSPCLKPASAEGRRTFLFFSGRPGPDHAAKAAAAGLRAIRRAQQSPRRTPVLSAMLRCNRMHGPPPPGARRLLSAPGSCPAPSRNLPMSSVIYPPLREQWFGNVRRDVLSGVLVALALIPEAIAFS